MKLDDKEALVDDNGGNNDNDNETLFESKKIPYIIKRATTTPSLKIPRALHNDFLTSSFEDDDSPFRMIRRETRASHRPVGGMTVELAMFFDEAGYDIFAPYLNNDDEQLRDMLLAYMNGVSMPYATQYVQIYEMYIKIS